MKLSRYLLLALLGLIGTGYAQAASVITITFDDLDLAPDSFWSGQIEPGSPPGAPSHSTFTSGNATFSNQITDWGGSTSWSGWAYSNRTDIVTPGFGNQYSVFTGRAFSGSQFGVAHVWGSDAAAITFAQPFWAVGANIANTTYTALSMLHGDAFAKKFGGADGTDKDWLKLSIKGVNGGETTGEVVFYLADFRGANNDIVREWEWVDLSSLGLITGLTFAMSSSDVGLFGMNTPAYFAMDNLTVVPLPAAIWFMASGWLALLGLTRRSKRERRWN